MMPRTELLKDILADLRMAASFVTILPVASSKPATDGAIARATWALPVAGLVVGLAGALVYKVASRFGLTPSLAALLALAATALITGALHEDGLADTADGLGGGRTRERKLEIMRDSRIGTYGVCALILTFGLRWSALATIANPWAVTLALCAAHAAARAGVPAFMSLVPPARPDGLSASAGQPPGRSVAIAFTLGILALTLAL
ncbi:adenosylcobinamide-GDP ribazoletransferase, partial [Bradyrhizobium cajani]